MRTGSGQRGQTRSQAYRPVRVVGLVLLAAHLGFVVWLAVRPSSSAWMLDANFTPFATVRQELTGGTAEGYREFAQGLLELAPLGVLLPMAGGRLDASPLWSFLRTVGAGLLLATAVEVLQTAVGGRVLDVDDIVLAVLGVVLAHLAVVPAGRAALRRRVAARAQPVSPRSYGSSAAARTTQTTA